MRPSRGSSPIYPSSLPSVSQEQHLPGKQSSHGPPNSSGVLTCVRSSHKVWSPHLPAANPKTIHASIGAAHHGMALQAAYYCCRLRGWAEGTRVGPPLFMSPTSAPGSSSGRSMSSASSSLQFAPGSQEAHPANQVQGEMQEARQQPDSRQHAPQEWQAKEAQPAPTLAAPPQVCSLHP
ncbi:hypothetical protein WJX77_010075 [Trebouxia sp. C0004]